MSTPFQNRLVGTIIVAAAAIIFLPDILNGDKHIHNNRFDSIPVAPKSDNIVAIKKFPSQKLARLPKEIVSDDIALDQQLSISHGNGVQNSDKNADSGIIKAKKNRKRKEVPFKKVLKKTSKSLAKNTIKKLNDTRAHSKKIIIKHKNQLNISTVTATSKKLLNQTNYAWVIQLGSFRERHNVDSLIRKLTKQGYTAFSRPIKTRHGYLIKVFVGPALSKTQLEKKIPKLKKLTNMQGKVTPFKPSK